MKFVMVMHEWFVSSDGFTVKEIDARDADDAHNIASDIAHARNSRACHNADATILQIADNEHLAPRRLTWRERLTGRLSYPPSPK